MSATISKFKYEGEDLQGGKVKGQIQAESMAAARNELAVKGTRVLKIKESKGLQTDIGTEKVPLMDLMHFCRQMSSFIRAGVPVLEALAGIQADTQNKRFKEILGDILQRVGNGSTIANAATFHESIFPAYFLAILRSSEHTGRMDEAFHELYRYIKRDVALNKQVRKALIYPMILLVVAIGVCAIIVIFVIPKFAEFFEGFGAELPLPTRMLIAVADFVGSTVGLIVGAGLVVAITATVVYFKTPKGRRVFHGILMGIPVLNTVIIYSATERFSRVMSVLLEAGVALSDALPAAVACSNNLVFQDRLAAASERVLEGAGFAEPMAQAQLFPPTMIQMMRVGERTGELSDQLANIADYYNEELDFAVDKLTEWFEPLVILLIGVVVGFVALAMVSAMYGIYGQVEV